MIKKINLIIATYAGKYYKFNSNNLEINKDKENYLKYNLLFINNNINNLSQITIMKPKINKEHIEIPDYYNFDNLNIDNIRNKIKIYECENIGISYGQYFTAIFKDLHFDYHIFIEDDYFPFIDNFDTHLTNLLDNFIEETYLCSFIHNKKTNIFNRLESCESEISKKQLKNYFIKYNLSTYDIILPDFSLGILSKKGVEKLIEKYKNIENILELYRIKFTENWVYQILFGYTFIISKINMIDYNTYLNIFCNSSDLTLYLCNVGSEKFQIWKNLSSNSKYELPLFLPIDIMYKCYNSDLELLQRYILNPQLFNKLLNNYKKINNNYKKSVMIINKTIDICIYISKNHKEYMPLLLYTLSLNSILKKYITNNITIVNSPEDLKVLKPSVLFVFSLSINDVINYFYPEQIKFIINTENYKRWNILEHLKILNNRNNINFIDYNSININYIKQNFKNINCVFIPQLYHPILNIYYNSLVTTKYNYLKKDIDILFYGNFKIERRKQILDILKNMYNVKIVFKENNNTICNLIERSKIVLDIFSMDDNKPFNYYKNIFLLCNNAILISEYPSDEEENLDAIQDLIVPRYNEIISCVKNILNNYNNYESIKLIIDKQHSFINKLKNMRDSYINIFQNLRK